MAVCEIDATGAVVQRWLDVKDLAEFTSKYGLDGPEYVEGKPARGEVLQGGKFVKPPKTKAAIDKEKTDKNAQDAAEAEGRAAALRIIGKGSEADFIAAVKWALRQ